MHRESVGLREPPIQTRGRPVKLGQYRSQREAVRFLGNILTDDRGVGLVYGPDSSGKSTLVKQFAQDLRADGAVAVVDGARLKTPDFLSQILAQFGYDVALNLTDELLNMLNVFLVQQTRANQAPVLILENMNNMYPSALCVLCRLAALTVHRRFALRIVLMSNRDFRRIMDSPSMSPISKRLIGDFELAPLTAREGLVYLYAELQSNGVDRPDNVFSVDISDKLHAATGGWPGVLDDIAMSIIDRGGNFPIRLEDIDHPAIRAHSGGDGDADEADVARDKVLPKLLITCSGESLREIELVTSSALLGRSSVSDIVIDNEFVSKHHALIMRVKDLVIVVDLKSKNGTFVNSRRVERAVLRDNDIISLGEHRIKMIYPNSPVSKEMEDPDIADTARMKNIADARQTKEQRVLPAAGIEKRKA